METPSMRMGCPLSSAHDLAQGAQPAVFSCRRRMQMVASDGVPGSAVWRVTSVVTCSTSSGSRVVRPGRAWSVRRQPARVRQRWSPVISPVCRFQSHSPRLAAERVSEQGLALAHLLFGPLAVGDVVQREQPDILVVKLGATHGLQQVSWLPLRVVATFRSPEHVRGVGRFDHARAGFGGVDAQVSGGAAQGFLAAESQTWPPRRD